MSVPGEYFQRYQGDLKRFKRATTHGKLNESTESIDETLVENAAAEEILESFKSTRKKMCHRKRKEASVNRLENPETY